MEQIPVGVPGLDELLGGGLPKGKSILLSGSCGTGKTVLSSQFVKEGVVRDEKCLYVTFDQSKDNLIKDMKEFGIDLAEMESGGKLRLIEGSIDRIKFFQDEKRTTMLDLLAKIQELVKTEEVHRVVLDSINLYTMVFDTESQRRKALVAFTSMLSSLGCTSLLLCEVKEGSNDISWYGFEDFVVDGVIVLKRLWLKSRFERAISVVKMRSTNHSHNMRAYRIESDGIVVYPDQEPFGHL